MPDSVNQPGAWKLKVAPLAVLCACPEPDLSSEELERTSKPAPHCGKFYRVPQGPRVSPGSSAPSWTPPLAVAKFLVFALSLWLRVRWAVLSVTGVFWLLHTPSSQRPGVHYMEGGRGCGAGCGGCRNASAFGLRTRKPVL